MLNADLKEINFTSDHDGLEISAVAAVPAENINGVVQIVHGMSEYKERYFDFMDYLAGEGFITAIHDNRGHGKSICTPDDIGFTFKNGGEGIIADIAQFNGIIRNMYPDVPCFMAAHSMGALAARCFLKKHDGEINGLVLMGTPSYNKFSGIIRCMNSVVVSGEKSRFRSNKVYEAAEKKLGKNFENVPHSWICSNKETVEKFNADPLCNFRYTLNGYECLLHLLKKAYSKYGWEVKNPDLPIRFISGKDDPVMISEKKFFRSIKTLEKVGYGSISHRLFDGMRHEILNEKNNTAVYRDIAKSLFSWIDRINSAEFSTEDQNSTDLF